MLRSTRLMAAAIVVSSSSVVLASTTAGAAAPDPLPLKGPSTNVNPYVLPSVAGVQITSLLTTQEATTTGKATDGYQFNGIPDGIGAVLESGKITAYVNHEISSGGGTRTHGGNGAYVDKLTIDPTTLEVIHGEDAIKTVSYWDYAGGAYAAAPTGIYTKNFARFCSGALAKVAQLFNGTSGNGYNGTIYFANEESSIEVGRVFGVLSDGTTKQLPRLGLASWENTQVAASGTDSTVVIGDPDATPGYIRVYQGTKQSTGDAFDKAGLTNGSSFALALADTSITQDNAFASAFGRNSGKSVTFQPVNWNQTGSAQATQAGAAKALDFNRIEDGEWDPTHPNDYYFVNTTNRTNGGSVAAGGGKGRLWKLHVNNLSDLSAGGSLSMLLDGTEGVVWPDNLTVDPTGNILLNEDAGNDAYIGKVWAYRINNPKVVQLAAFDSAKFGSTTSPTYETQDEETSGILDATDTLGAGYYLFDAQNHGKLHLTDAANQVENGQLLAMKVDWPTVYAATPDAALPEVPLAVGLPLLGGLILGGLAWRARRREAGGLAA